ILSSKYKGIDNLKYISIFGTRAFIDFISPKIHQVDESGKYTITFDSYFLYQVNNYFYQLSNYDVAIETTKYLEKIDQDRSIIAANIDG
ncbi:LysR family transcriptional regulator, partial [Francisella tularensis subsp. holarctica]|nr:LysR family transcriptional regulator [Francisella tularensis subsp. holarctica]